MHIGSLEAHADAEHASWSAFVQQGTHVLVSQLNSGMTTYRAESEQFQASLIRVRQNAMRKSKQQRKLTSQNMSLNTRALTPL